MPIQFKCPSCSQPIEVDDDHAQTQVICYYCSNVITVPDASTLTAQDIKAGASRPLDQSGPVFTHISQQDDAPALQQVSQQEQSGDVQKPPPDAGPEQRTLAIVSISCGLGCLAIFMIMILAIMLSILAELQEYPDLNIEQQQKLLIQKTEEKMGTPAMAAGSIAALLLAISGSGCGLAAIIRKTGARRWAWVGFLISTAFLFCQCAGSLTTISAGLAGATG